MRILGLNVHPIPRCASVPLKYVYPFDVCTHGMMHTWILQRELCLCAAPRLEPRLASYRVAKGLNVLLYCW